MLNLTKEDKEIRSIVFNLRYAASSMLFVAHLLRDIDSKGKSKDSNKEKEINNMKKELHLKAAEVMDWLEEIKKLRLSKECFIQERNKLSDVLNDDFKSTMAEVILTNNYIEVANALVHNANVLQQRVQLLESKYHKDFPEAFKV